MRYRTNARLRRRREDWQMGGLLIVVVVGLLIAVGTIEYAEQRDRFEYCLFQALPDDSLAAVQACAEKTHYYPEELLKTMGVVK